MFVPTLLLVISRAILDRNDDQSYVRKIEDDIGLRTAAWLHTHNAASETPTFYECALSARRTQTCHTILFVHLLQIRILAVSRVLLITTPAVFAFECDSSAGV